MHSINPRRRPFRDVDEADVWAFYKSPEYAFAVDALQAFGFPPRRRDGSYRIRPFR